MKRKHIVFLVLFFCISMIAVFFRDHYRHTALKNYKKTYAIITKIGFGGKGPGNAKFVFLNDKNKLVKTHYSSNLSECSNNLQTGDTIYIRYSLTDNSVAEIIHCYWNDKLRRDMENQ